MTNGTAAAMILRDILGKENEWAPVFLPSRIKHASAGKFVTENVNVAAPDKGKLLLPEKSNFSQVKQSAEIDGKSGAFRDMQGQHIVDTVPHGL